MELHDHIPTRNVLVAVDVQHDFVDGSLAVTEGEQVVEPLNELAEAVRTNLGRVAFTRDWHPASTPHFDTWPVHCVAGTKGADFFPALAIKEDDVVVSKGMGQTDGYSGIEGVAANGETLESIIDPEGRWENVHVFIGGLATDYCVKATATDLAERFKKYPAVEIHAIPEAMRAVNIQPNDGINAVEAMAAAGVHITSLKDALAMIDTTRVEA